MSFAFDGQVYYPDLWRDEMPWLHLGCSTRKFVTGGPSPEGSTREARALVELLGLEAPLLRCWQKHTNRVAVAGAEELAQANREGYFMWDETDGVVCPVAGGGVCVAYTADCVPVLLVDCRTRAVAAVHSGWRGTVGRIASRGVDLMLAQGSRAEDLRAWIGPCASGRRYEVSEELIAQFLDEFSDAASDGVSFVDGRLLNLPALVMFQLRCGGLREDAIVNSDLCTIEHCDLFSSYRMRANEEDKSRIISFVYAAPDGGCM
ncbi:polyphenol oxidase family protein [Candidatus Sumerlaeota bacterium]|mgnify:CR=1 FL=1|nr:polyphenol oxidase family protein [Candidatus Sumerlaeales bacterium]NLD62238.1 polyphenol oxidase family protein [Candidatus Sumerlaeota bacterium]